MPQALPFIAYAAVKVVGGKVLATIAYMAVDGAVRKRAAKKAQKANRSRIDVSKEVTLKSAIEPYHVVYGTIATGGLLTHYNVAGSGNADLWSTHTYAGHSCNDITSVYFDDRYVTAANIGTWAVGSSGKAVEGGDYFIDGTAYAKFYKFLGDPAQTHNTEYAAALTEWTSAHDGEGMTYMQSKLTLTEDSAKIFEVGAPQATRAVVEGKDDIYDPILQFPALTVTQASVNQTAIDNATYQISESSISAQWDRGDNPIIQVADYMLRYIRVDSSGYGISPDRIDWQTVLDESIYCDQQAITSTTDTTEKRFTSNGLLSLGDNHLENIAKLLSSCNGRLSHKNGRFYIRAGRYGYGQNMVSNGTFASLTGWTKFGDGTAASSGNQLLLTRNASGTLVGVYQDVTTVVGNTYCMTVQTKPSSNESNDYLLYAQTTVPDTLAFHAGTTEDAELRVEFVATTTTSRIVLICEGTNTQTAEFDNAEMYLVAETEIDEDWLRDDLQINTATPKSDRFNNARGFYNSAEEAYKKVQSMQVRNTAFESRDNSERLFEHFELPFTVSEDMSQRLLHKRVQATDEQITVRLPCNYKALQVAVHDWIQLTLSEFSWSKKIFRVVGCEIMQSDGVDLILREDSIDAYQDPDLADYSVRTPGGMTFGTQEVPDPTSVTLTARTSLPDLTVAWATIAPQFYDVAEIWRHTSNSFVSATKIAEVRASTYTDTTATIGASYYYWVRFRWGTEYSSEVATSPTNSTAAAIAAGTAAAVEWENVLDGSGTIPDDSATNNGAKMDTSGDIQSNINLLTNGSLSVGKTSAGDSANAGIWLGDDGVSDYDFFVSNATFTTGLKWDGSAGTLLVKGDITIGNPGDINTNDLNNDAGFTDDTAADAAQGDATTAVNASQHYDASGNITGGILMTGSGTITLSSAGHIKGGQTDYSTGTGFFLGYSGGDYKFSIGDGGTTNYMEWDGTALNVGGDVVISGGSGIANLSDAGLLAVADIVRAGTEITRSDGSTVLDDVDVDNQQYQHSDNLAIDGNFAKQEVEGLSSPYTYWTPSTSLTTIDSSGSGYTIEDDATDGVRLAVDANAMTAGAGPYFIQQGFSEVGPGERIYFSCQVKTTGALNAAAYAYLGSINHDQDKVYINTNTSNLAAPTLDNGDTSWIDMQGSILVESMSTGGKTRFIKPFIWIGSTATAGNVYVRNFRVTRYNPRPSPRIVGAELGSSKTVTGTSTTTVTSVTVTHSSEDRIIRATGVLEKDDAGVSNGIYLKFKRGATDVGSVKLYYGGTSVDTGSELFAIEEIDSAVTSFARDDLTYTLTAYGTAAGSDYDFKEVVLTVENAGTDEAE